jgi:hypothetical protein
VCEREFKRKNKAQHQYLCGRRKCANENKQFPHLFTPFGRPGYQQPNGAIAKKEKAGFTAFKVPDVLRRWSWQKLPGEDEDYDGKPVARIRQEGACGG